MNFSLEISKGKLTADQTMLNIVHIVPLISSKNDAESCRLLYGVRCDLSCCPIKANLGLI